MKIESNLPTVIDVDARLTEIAKRYKQAGGVGISVLNLIGGQADNLIDKLPGPVRRNLESATVKALNSAMRAAHSSRSYVPIKKAGLIRRQVPRWGRRAARAVYRRHWQNCLSPRRCYCG